MQFDTKLGKIMTNNIFLCSRELTDLRRVTEAEILSTVSPESINFIFCFCDYFKIGVVN